MCSQLSAPLSLKARQSLERTYGVAADFVAEPFLSQTQARGKSVLTTTVGMHAENGNGRGGRTPAPASCSKTVKAC